jgi:hypothetical protein
MRRLLYTVLIFDVFVAEPTWYKVADGPEEALRYKFLKVGTEVVLSGTGGRSSSIRE